MGVSRGPSPIVTDGLVFAADAGNTRCYTSGSTTGTGLVFNSLLTLNNNVTYSPLGGGSWNFAGTDPSVSTPSYDAINFDADSDYSLCDWVRMDSETAYDAHIEKSASGNGYIANIHSSGGTITLRFWLNNVNVEDYITSKTYLNTWHYLVWTKTAAGVVAIYEDGVLVATNTGNTGKPSTTVDPLFIGNDQYSSEIDGKITAVTIYNKALTSEEVLQNYNAQKPRFGL